MLSSVCIEGQASESKTLPNNMIWLVVEIIVLVLLSCSNCYDLLTAFIVLCYSTKVWGNFMSTLENWQELQNAGAWKLVIKPSEHTKRMVVR